MMSISSNTSISSIKSIKSAAPPVKRGRIWLYAFIAATFASRLLLGYATPLPGISSSLIRAVDHWSPDTRMPITADGFYPLLVARLIHLLLPFLSEGAAILAFNALLAAGSMYLIHRVAERLLDHRSAFLATLLLASSTAFFYYSSHPILCAVEVFMLLLALDLLTSGRKSREDIGALVIGLSAGVSIAGLVPMLALLGVAISAGRKQSQWSGRRALALVSLAFAGIASWLALMIFYFGASALPSQLFDAYRHNTGIPYLLAQLVFVINLLFPYLGIPKTSSLGERGWNFGWVAVAAVLVALNLSDASPILMLVPLAAIQAVTMLHGRKRNIFVGAFVALNILLFFFPAIKPIPELSLNRDQQRADETTLTVSRLISFELPSWWHLHNVDVAITEATKLLTDAKANDSTLIVLTPATAYWFDEHSFHERIPRAQIMYWSGDFLNRVHTSWGADTTFVRPVCQWNRVLLLTETSFNRSYFGSTFTTSKQVAAGPHFMVQEIPPEERNLMIDRFFALFYTSRHQH